MSEEVKIDDKFHQAALFDLEFEGREQRNADFKHKLADFAQESSEYHKSQEQQYSEWLAEYHKESEPLKSVFWCMEYAPAELKAQATKYLDNLVNKDEFDLRRESWANNNKKKGIDLDGSKKTLWGKVKNKVKNFWRPFNAKKGLEEAIDALKDDMLKNPEFYKDLREQATKDGDKRVSFQKVVQAQKEISTHYNNRRVDYMFSKKENAEMAQRNESEAQKSEATIAAIHQVRDKTAKEIELRAMARETTGIKDAQTNTGIDRLEDKAKMMEGMSPEQRLAFRMSQLRGTQNDTSAKPAEKRKVNANVINKALESKMRA